MQRVIAPILIGLAGVAVLVSLGVWQVQRLAWKEGVLAEIDARVFGTPGDLPVLIDPEAQKYLPVAMQGKIGAESLYVLVSVKDRGAGWRVISDFTTTQGRRVLLDRGYVPVDRKSVQGSSGQVLVTGNLHWPDDRNSSTPDNDPGSNTWFARDIAQMAEALKTEPLLVVTRSTDPADQSVLPLPLDTAAIPNDHLQYAVTWFSLAAVWLIMTGVWIRRRLKED